MKKCSYLTIKKMKRHVKKNEITYNITKFNAKSRTNMFEILYLRMVCLKSYGYINLRKTKLKTTYSYNSAKK